MTTPLDSNRIITDFDHLLEREIGGHGAYQLLALVAAFLVCLAAMTVPSYSQSHLVAAPMHYRCVDSAQFSTSTRGANSSGYDECWRAETKTHHLRAETKTHQKREETKTHQQQCGQFQFSSPYFQSTMVSEFELVCSRAYLAALYKMSLIGGMLVGLVVCGLLADRYGRKRIVACCLPLLLGATLVTSMTGSFPVAVAMRTLFGFAYAGLWKGVIVLR